MAEFSRRQMSELGQPGKKNNLDFSFELLLGPLLKVEVTRSKGMLNSLIVLMYHT